MVYVTFPSEEEARRISMHLLERRLVACSNVFPVRSYYRWRGEVREDDEWVAVMKTRADLAQDAVDAVNEIHPYDVPCAVAYSMTAGSGPYLRWIEDETRKG